MLHSRAPAFAAAAAIGFLSCASSATAADQLYFSARTNVTNILVNYINHENVRLDISSWYLSEHAISIAIANRFAAGVRVRIIGDRAAIFEADAHTKAEFYWLANKGIPIRLRFNPTYFPEIDHWKAAIFVGQNIVEFGSGNFAPTELLQSKDLPGKGRNPIDFQIQTFLDGKPIGGTKSGTVGFGQTQVFDVNVPTAALRKKR